MQLHNLKSKTKRKLSRQVGRGGTRGKTSGKGTKGQNARAGRKKRPELRDFIKRFPKLRGRGISPFKSMQTKPFSINLSVINSYYKAGETVSPKTVIEKKIINIKNGTGFRVKILGTGELTHKLVFEDVVMSEGAKAKIEAAGSEVREAVTK